MKNVKINVKIYIKFESVKGITFFFKKYEPPTSLKIFNLIFIAYSRSNVKLL